METISFMILTDPIIWKEDTEVPLFTDNIIIKLWIAIWKSLRNIEEGSKKATREKKIHTKINSLLIHYQRTECTMEDNPVPSQQQKHFLKNP